MEKALCVILIVLLCSCSNHKSYACSKTQDNQQILLTINSVNDTITEIIIDEKYEIDKGLLSLGDRFFEYVDSLDESYKYLNGYLYRHQIMELDDNYSAQLTLQKLRKDRYYCD